MKKTAFSSIPLIITSAVLLGASPWLIAADFANPFIGRWALDLPGGGAGWLGIEDQNGSLKGTLLWGGGSVLPAAGTKMENGVLVFSREVYTKDDGKVVRHIETISARLEGDKMELKSITVDPAGIEIARSEFKGGRIADLPPKPDLSQVKFGNPISLLNGKDLAGWTVLNEKAPNCWSVIDGVLVNNVVAADGTNQHGTNIRTEAEFEDFNLKAELRVPEGGNSGIYLRGVYEVQVAESFGKPCDSHNMGALYSRIVPSVAAEKPAGVWQTLDITLVDRHLTVLLNGVTIIDNQPVLGCTGGALTSDEFQPGPIFLQGDHTNVEYRKLELTPVIR
ncbi:MAG: DUF1080 domain-containing protein [Luteolibacter sp.]|nr:DUF1080 domain-containing protein [Luteolibacter sp.]